MIAGRESRLFFVHTLLLISGGLTGLLLGILLDRLPWDFSADLERARQLGIVSETILNNYPKRRDLLTFVLAYILPVCGALAFWLPWGLKRRKLLKHPWCRNDFDPHPLRPWLLAGAALVLLAATFDLNTIYEARWNSQTGAWPFLGEEGEFLEWTQRILAGEVQGKDFFCLYGPLMLYPLALLQKVAGPAVSLVRWYSLLLNVIAYVLFAVVLNRTIRSTFVCLLGMLSMIVLYPWLLNPANVSPLRFMLGIVPLMSLLRFQSTGSRRSLAAAGALTGLSFLFSQEMGMCSLIASLAFLSMLKHHQGNLKAVPVCLLIFGSGLLSLLVPFVLYFMYKGALPHLVDNIFSYPNLVMLGYGGRRFPSLSDAAAYPFAPLVFDNYLIILVYVVATCLLVTCLLTGRTKAQTFAAVYVLLFGLLLFRSALGRSGTDKAYLVSFPMLFILFMAADHYGEMLRQYRSTAVKFFAALVLATFLLAVTRLTFIPVWLDSFTSKFLSAGRYTYRPFGAKTEGVVRNDVLHPPGTAGDLLRIADFLMRHEAGPYIYFFPNEPAYYFLFDKKNPTRYPMSYLTVTADMRREAVTDLDRHKPEYVVYSIDTWRPDDIPENIQVPEIYEYLKAMYEVVEDQGSVVFLRRKHPVHPK